MFLRFEQNSVIINPFLADKSAVPFILNCPPDKSLTHRAFIFSFLSKGNNIIENPLLSEDCLHTLKSLKSLGCKTNISNNIVTIDSSNNFTSPSSPLDFGNSGTTARLLIGVISSMPGLVVICNGDQSLSRRPMQRIIDPLINNGAKIYYLEKEGYLPIKIEGTTLKPHSYKLPIPSAQLKSALILSALNIKGKTEITLPKGSRNHTELILRKLGAQIDISHINGKELITITGPFSPPASTYKIPGDPSSASFFALLAAHGLKININNVVNNNTRLAFLKIFEKVGLNYSLTSDPNTSYIEDTCNLEISPSNKLSSFNITPDDVPSLIDEIPVLSVLAALAKGPCKFEGLFELRVKESDRLSQIQKLIKQLGARCIIDNNDNLIIDNQKLPFKPFTFFPQKDHRMAMAASIAALFASGPCTIHDANSVNISFPNFYDLLFLYYKRNVDA